MQSYMKYGANLSSLHIMQCILFIQILHIPHLFLLYINDLPNCLMHSQPRMYADDTSITYASNDVEEIERCVNIDLDRIRIWLAANKLTLNTTKTDFLLIGSRQRLNARKESHN